MSTEAHPLRSIDWQSRATVAEAKVEELETTVKALKEQLVVKPKRSWWARLWGKGDDCGLIDIKTGKPLIRLGETVVVDGQRDGDIKQSFILRLGKQTRVKFRARWACNAEDLERSPTLAVRYTNNACCLLDVYDPEEKTIAETAVLPPGDYEVWSYQETGDPEHPWSSLLTVSKA